MSNDYRAEPLSNQQIEDIADSTRIGFGIASDGPPDLVEILQRSEIPTRFGAKSLSLQIVADGALEGDDARTFTFPEKVVIEVEKTVWSDAINRQTRPTMTLAHELGHAVLHEKPVALGRASVLFDTKRPGYLRGYDSSEHQAKYFGAAFLMPRHAVNRYRSAHDLAKAYRVSLKAAEIRMEQCASKSARIIPLRTQKVIDEIKANAARPAFKAPKAPHLTAWEQLPRVEGEDPAEIRQSFSGYQIRKSDFNKIGCHGWFLEQGRVIAALERHDCS